MTTLMAHLTPLESAAILGTFLLGCLVGGATVLGCARRFLRKSGR